MKMKRSTPASRQAASLAPGLPASTTDLRPAALSLRGDLRNQLRIQFVGRTDHGDRRAAVGKGVGCGVGVVEAVVANDFESAGFEEVLGVGRSGRVMRDRPHVGQKHRRPFAMGRLPGVAGIAQFLERLGETSQFQRRDFDRSVVKAQARASWPMVAPCIANSTAELVRSFDVEIDSDPIGLRSRCCNAVDAAAARKASTSSRRMRSTRCSRDIGEFADTGDAFLATCDVFGPRSECRVDLSRRPSRLVSAASMPPWRSIC